MDRKTLSSGFASFIRDNWLVLIFLVGLLLRIFLVVSMKDYEPDSYIRFGMGEKLAKTPFAIYNNGVFLPFFQYVVAVLVYFGGNLTSVRIMSAIVGSLLTIPVYKMSFLISKNKVLANFCAVLVSLNPVLVVYGSLAMSESLFVLLVSLTVYLLAARRYAWASIPLTLAVLTRYESWVLLPAIPLYFVFKERRSFLEKLIPVLVSCIAIVGWLWVNKLYFNDPFFFLKNVGALNLPYRYDVPTVWGVPAVLRGVFGFVLYPLVYPLMYVPVLSMVLYLRRASSVKSSYAGSFMLFILIVYDAFLTVTQVLHASWGWSRHFLPLIPLYVVLGSACLRPSITKRKLVLILVLSLSISAVVTYLQVSVESAFLSPI